MGIGINRYITHILSVIILVVSLSAVIKLRARKMLTIEATNSTIEIVLVIFLDFSAVETRFPRFITDQRSEFLHKASFLIMHSSPPNTNRI